MALPKIKLRTAWYCISGSLLLAAVAGCDFGHEPQIAAREPYDATGLKFFELDSELEWLKRLESTGKVTAATFTVTKRDDPEVRIRREGNRELPMTVMTVTEDLAYTVGGKQFGYQNTSERFREFVGPTPQSVTLSVDVIYLPDHPNEFFVGDRDDLQSRISEITKELEDL